MKPLMSLFTLDIPVRFEKKKKEKGGKKKQTNKKTSVTGTLFLIAEVFIHFAYFGANSIQKHWIYEWSLCQCLIWGQTDLSVPLAIARSVISLYQKLREQSFLYRFFLVCPLGVTPQMEGGRLGKISTISLKNPLRQNETKQLCLQIPNLQILHKRCDVSSSACKI